MSMKVGIVFFHKDLEKIYREEWITSCIESIKNQTYKDLIYYEIDYSGKNKNLTGCKNFYSDLKENYADAMNFIITKAFNDGCDFVFNTNMDDIFEICRIEKQIKYLNKGYDIVSSDFSYIDQDGNFKFNMLPSYYNGQIKHQLNENHNVIAHPAVGYSKKFWEGNKYDISKVPEEDLDLWRRAANNGYRFYIIPEILLKYRIHNNQVSTKK
jgi:GT2 family glycosyltransferase